MRYVDEFRERERIQQVVSQIAAACTKPWTVMEICGGQTHTIARYGIDELVPEGMTLVHGPGCPVCVTPLEVLEGARRLAVEAGVTLCTFGDMLRVPGVGGDLLSARAEGADVRIVVSPLDAVALARREPERQVAFLAVGFETTAPATAMAADVALREGLDNFTLVPAHVRVPPAMEAILGASDCEVEGFLAAGHVCTVEGFEDYPAIAERHRVPIVVTGFEPLDLLLGLLRVVEMLEGGEVAVDNRYARSVREHGNPHARAVVDKVYVPADRPWRGLGIVPAGGLALRPPYDQLDALHRFSVDVGELAEPEECRAAEVLRGRLQPADCPEFGRACTPEHPLGAPMVSTEGACAAYHRFRARAGA